MFNPLFQVIFTKNIFRITTIKLGDKERFDKEQIGVKESLSVTNCQFTS